MVQIEQVLMAAPLLQVNGQIPRGFVVLKPGHEETEENLTNFLESRLQVYTP